MASPHSRFRITLALSCAALAFIPVAHARSTTSMGDLTPDEFESLQHAYQESLHTAVQVNQNYQAHNPGQELELRFDGQGLEVTPDVGEWNWGLDLESYGFTGFETKVTLPRLVHAEGGRVTYDWNAELDEWYVNDERGLEHGYTLLRRPGHGELQGALRFRLSIVGGLSPQVTTDGRGVRFLDPSGEAALNYTGLKVFDASGRNLPAYFEGSAQNLTIVVDETKAVYPLTVDPIVQQAYLKASNPGKFDNFGSSLAVDGDTVVVGAVGEMSNAVGVNGNQLNNDFFSAGAAYVFTRNGTGWSQQAYLKASNTEAFDRFGSSVAISGDRIAIGAPTEDGGSSGLNGNQADNSVGLSGAVYLFERTGTTWSQVAYVKASNPDPADGFGTSVALSGNTLVVGAVSESSQATGVNGNQADNSFGFSGAAYVFGRSGATWAQQAYLKASAVDGGDRFGSAVAVDLDTIVIGASGEGSSATGVDGNDSDNSLFASGAAYVFTRLGTTWTQQAYLKASNTNGEDSFGTGVAVSGNTVVVGAPFERSGATGVDGGQANNLLFQAGAAYVFERVGITWTQAAYLKASNTGRLQLFGESVDVSGNTIVAGAQNEGSKAKGANGNQSDTSEFGSGAAHIFKRVAGTWTSQAILKPSNTGSSDGFGSCVAISNDTVVATAPSEDGSASGVNGDGSDNSMSSSGAAYIFDLAATTGASRYGKYEGANIADLFSTSPASSGSLLSLELTDFNRPGVAFLMISSAPTTLPMFFGGTLLVDLNQSVLGASGTIPVLIRATPEPHGQLLIALSPSMIGLTFFAQAAKPDLSQPFGWAWTNGLEITVAP